MARAPFQVLVFPFRKAADNQILYAIFQRADFADKRWQGIAGGGEDDETPLEAARRETNEEAGIDPKSDFIELDSCNTVPAVEVCGLLWGERILVLPEHCFGARVEAEQLRLSDEHREYRWVSYEEARRMLYWDSNRNALWELNWRLTKGSGR